MCTFFHANPHMYACRTLEQIYGVDILYIFQPTWSLAVFRSVEMASIYVLLLSFVLDSLQIVKRCAPINYSL